MKSLLSAPPILSNSVKQLSNTFSNSLKKSYLSSENPNEENNNNNNEDSIRDREEKLIFCLISAKVLIVLDHINDLLVSANSEAVTDLRMFLGRLFERCRHVKVCYIYILYVIYEVI